MKTKRTIAVGRGVGSELIPAPSGTFLFLYQHISQMRNLIQDYGNLQDTYREWRRFLWNSRVSQEYQENECQNTRRLDPFCKKTYPAITSIFWVLFPEPLFFKKKLGGYIQMLLLCTQEIPSPIDASDAIRSAECKATAKPTVLCSSLHKPHVD